MPRMVAPPPSGEYMITLTKPFSGHPTEKIEVLGEKNRAASVKKSQYNGSNSTSVKVGDMPHDDVQELMRLIDQCRGFPSHPSKDVYGLDVKLDFNTFEIQWSNGDEDDSADVVNEIGNETKITFREVVQSIEALGRQFAKKDAAN